MLWPRFLRWCHGMVWFFRPWRWNEGLHREITWVERREGQRTLHVLCECGKEWR